MIIEIKIADIVSLMSQSNPNFYQSFLKNLYLA